MYSLHGRNSICTAPQSFDQFAHLVVVRTLPIDLPAIWALVKLVEVLSGERLQQMQHLSLFHWLQGMIAFQATMKRSNASGKVEAHDTFFKLFHRIEGAQAVAMLHFFAHQQTAVTGQQNASLRGDDISHIWVVEVVLVEAIKAEGT